MTAALSSTWTSPAILPYGTYAQAGHVECKALRVVRRQRSIFKSNPRTHSRLLPSGGIVRISVVPADASLHLRRNRYRRAHRRRPGQAEGVQRHLHLFCMVISPDAVFLFPSQHLVALQAPMAMVNHRRVHAAPVTHCPRRCQEERLPRRVQIPSHSLFTAWRGEPYASFSRGRDAGKRCKP